MKWVSITMLLLAVLLTVAVSSPLRITTYCLPFVVCASGLLVPLGKREVHKVNTFQKSTSSAFPLGGMRSLATPSFVAQAVRAGKYPGRQDSLQLLCFSILLYPLLVLEGTFSERDWSRSRLRRRESL